MLATHSQSSDIMVTESLMVMVAILILIIAGILIYIYISNNMTTAYLVRSLTCGILYVIGDKTGVTSQGCSTISA